jgi:hypothetical protein
MATDSVRASLEDVAPERFDISVISAGQPTRRVAVASGSTLADLAELAGVSDPSRASAMVGTGELVDASYLLTSADERVSFIQRLAGAGHDGCAARG